MKIIEPSLLAYSRNESNLRRELMQLQKQNISSIHYDVMDGLFVRNTAFEGEFIDMIHEMGFDITVHLMVQDVDAYVEKFLQYPIKALTFQAEAISVEHSLKIIKKIKKAKVMAGIAIKPTTKITTYQELYKKIDVLTFMSVEPGAGGQAFIDESTRRVRQLKDLLPPKVIIQMDGGLNDFNSLLVRKDVDWFVMGSFSKQNIDKLAVIQDELNGKN